MTVTIENLEFSYRGAGAFGLRIPSLKLDVGQSYLLLGASGSGKSTLLNLLAGTLRPHSGRLQLAGQDLTAIRAAQLDRFRGEHVGFVFQGLNLMPWLSARDNVVLGLAFAPQRRKRIFGPVNDAAEKLLGSLNIDAAAAATPAGELSIGQQQRVAAARALIGAPELILADEPSSALDEGNTETFFNLLMSGLDATRQTLLVVSHDTRLTPHFDHVLDVRDILQPGGTQTGGTDE